MKSCESGKQESRKKNEFGNQKTRKEENDPDFSCFPSFLIHR
jgi:hypothetical protein